MTSGKIYWYLSTTKICLCYLACLKLVVLATYSLFLQRPFVAHLPRQMVCLSLSTHIWVLTISVTLGKICSQSLLHWAKLLEPFWVIGGFSFWIASILLLNDFTQTLLYFIKIVTHILQFCFKQLALFGDIFKPLLHNAHNKYINFSRCVCLLGMNSNRSSMIASQYFLLDKQLSIAFMYDCHTTGEMLSPIGILWYTYDALPKYGSIPQYFLEFSVNLSEWNASFRSGTDNTLHFELPSNVNVSLQ